MGKQVSGDKCSRVGWQVLVEMADRQAGTAASVCGATMRFTHTHTHTHTHQPLRSRAVLDDLTNYPLVPGLPAGSAARRPIASEF